jgi:branched-chain amino acid transport system substrate-binding protein
MLMQENKDLMMKKFILLTAKITLFLTFNSFASQGVSDTEIIIGIHTDISGPVSSFGKYSVEGIQMRMDEINKKGGINGRSLKLVAEDHQYQVPRAVQAANKLLNKDKIFLMVGSLGTSMNNAVFSSQEAKNVPNLFPLSSARSMAEPLHRLKFSALSTYYDQARAGVKWAVEEKGKNKICVLYQDNDFGQESYEATIDQLKSMNMELHEKATNKPTDTDLTSQINKLKNAGCEAVTMGTIVKDTILAYTKARQIGWDDAIFMGTVASFHPVIASQPDGVTNNFYTFAQFDSPSRSNCSGIVCDWIDEYESMFGNLPNIGSAYGYMYMDITAKAIESAGQNLTTDSFLNSLEKMDNYQIPWGETTLSFGPDKHLGANESYLFIVKDGEFIKVSDQPYTY